MSGTMTDGPHQRRCWDCGNVAEHSDSVTPWVLCGKCGSQDTRRVKRQPAKYLSESEGTWARFEFASIWIGPDIDLIVIQNGGSSESWKWTARGWREPDGDWMVDASGWVSNTTRSGAEKEALRFYLEKDE